MTKTCLEFIISGCLTRLDNLDLFLTLIGEHDREREIEEKDNNVVLWKKITVFCSAKLKHYNITFVNPQDDHLFSLDNCEDENDQYYKKYRYENDYYDNDNDYYVFDETSEYWD